MSRYVVPLKTASEQLHNKLVHLLSEAADSQKLNFSEELLKCIALIVNYIFFFCFLLRFFFIMTFFNQLLNTHVPDYSFLGGKALRQSETLKPCYDHG